MLGTLTSGEFSIRGADVCICVYVCVLIMVCLLPPALRCAWSIVLEVPTSGSPRLGVQMY